MSSIYNPKSNNVSQMDFNTLRNKVQELEDTIIKLKRLLEDSLQNLDDSNFTSQWMKEKENMQSKISVSADELSSVYTKMNEDKSKLETSITQNAEAISLKASKTYVDDKVANAELNVSADEINAAVENSMDAAKLSIKSDTIESIVGRSISAYIEVDKISELPKNPTVMQKSTVYKTKFDDDGNSDVKYFYYDDGWKQFNGNYKSIFKQSGSGFYLQGNVRIDGNLISNNTISADKVKTDELSCTGLYGYLEDGDITYGGKNNSAYLSIYPITNAFGGTAALGFFKSDVERESAHPQNEDCYFGIVKFDITGTNLYACGKNFLGYNKDNAAYGGDLGVTFAKGPWQFTGYILRDVQIKGGVLNIDSGENTGKLNMCGDKIMHYAYKNTTTDDTDGTIYAHGTWDFTSNDCKVILPNNRTTYK